ncbi:thioesterase family protein [uncultured Maribacter sp.]|uniref:acyl-CoA thioesterase n=1 Tax=uncultured Maribacter sp. TaxID=431308 RepID=UPI0026166ECA|nr:thioesterase family protein [uncultured Maribacter sp.]
MSFKKTITVAAHDLDDLDHVNNVRYVQWIQDISKEHWKAKAPNHLQELFIWVVLTHNIAYKKPAQLGDKIIVKTHISESKGAISIRIVEMYNAKTNILLLRSSTEWCLLNAKTHKPMRISKELKNVFTKSKNIEA